MSVTKPNLDTQAQPIQVQGHLVPEPEEIWLLIDSQTFGGIETHVIELALGLLKHNRKARVVLLTKFAPLPPVITRLKDLDLPYSHLNDLAPSKTNSVSQLKLAITQYKPTHVHAHGYKASIVSKLVKLVTPSHCKPRQISTYHAGETPKGKVWLYDFLDRYTGFLSNHCFVVSNKIQDKIPSRTTLLNNFIAIPDSSPNAQHLIYESNIKQIYHVGFVGRLSHEKAPDRFVALAQFAANHKFHLFGDGPERQTLEKSKPNNLTFHGHQTSMDNAWKTIDVLVIPSRYEGLPMAALEAMARGIPVIATNVGNLSQLIQHESNGYIATNESELTACLTSWFDLPSQDKQTMGMKAKATIREHYSPQAVIPQILACYSA